MFTKIMVPVDLENVSALEASLKVAIDLGKLYGAAICYFGATAAAPSAVAHSPAEFAEKLQAFADHQAAAGGVTVEIHAATTHDPATDLNDALLRAVEDTGADLVVMATHLPGVSDALWASHGGTVASHAKVSVLLVR